MGYVTIAEARAEGVPDPPDDTLLQAAIDLWSNYIDEACHQWFDERSVTLLLDGPGAPTLFLPVPIIEVTELYLNENWTVAVDPEFYAVYDSRTVPDDRKNPRITLKQSRPDLFTMAAFGPSPVFANGVQNQKVVGKFGYLEPDNSTPPLIKRAVMKLLSKSLEPMYSATTLSALTPGPVKTEKTDAHSITYAFSESLVKGNLGITGDAEVAAIVRMYRAPWAIGVPIQYGE